jgi:hypothetical protein
MRWQDEAEGAVERAGGHVVDTAGVDDWAGWGCLLARRGDEWGVLSWSYGSCSGCDSYEDLDAEHRRECFDELLDWKKSEDDARTAFSNSKGW